MFYSLDALREVDLSVNGSWEICQVVLMHYKLTSKLFPCTANEMWKKWLLIQFDCEEGGGLIIIFYRLQVFVL